MSNPQVELHIAGKGVILIELDATPTGMGGPFRTDVPKTPVVILSITLVQ